MMRITKQTATLAVSIDRFLDVMRFDLNRSEKSVVEYRRALKVLAGQLGPETLVGEVRREDISAGDGGVLSVWTRKGASANTICKNLSVYRSFFEFCLEREWCDRNPARSIPRPKRPEPNGPRFEWAEVTRLLELVRTEGSTRDYVVMMLAAVCGLRISSISALRWRDIHFDSSSASVWLKGDRHKVIHLQPKLRAALRTLQEELEPNNGADDPVIQVYTSQRAYYAQPRPLATEGLRRLFKRWFKRAGLPWQDGTGTGGHTLRRSFAYELRRQRWDIARISEALGHKSIETTVRHYAFPDDEETRAMLESLRI